MDSKAVIKPRSIVKLERIKVTIDGIDHLNMEWIYNHIAFPENYLNHCCHNCRYWSEEILIKP